MPPFFGGSRTPRPQTDRFGRQLPSDIIHQRAMQGLGSLFKNPPVPPMPPTPPAPEMFTSPSTDVSIEPPPGLGGGAPGVVEGQGPPWLYQEAPGGFMRREAGPGLGGSDVGALAGLQARQYQAPPQRPQAELYRQAFAPEFVGMAPGARESATAQLKEQLGMEDFQRQLSQREQEIPRMAQARLAPPVQQEADIAARRASIPAQIQARGQGLAGMFGLQRAQEAAGGQVEAARARRDALAHQALIRGISELSSGPQDETDEELQIRMDLLQRFDQMEKALRTGEYFLSDYAEIDPLAAGVLESIIDESEEADLGFGF